MRRIFVAVDDGQTNSVLFHLSVKRRSVDDGQTNSVLFHLSVWPSRVRPFLLQR